jgi:hypothetical protein
LWEYNSKPGNPSAAYQITTDEVAQSINHATWDALEKKCFSKRKCKLQGLSKDSKQLQAYLNELSANVPTKSSECYACLLINAYNAYTVKLILDNYPTKSIKDINDPWGKKILSLEIKNIA